MLLPPLLSIFCLILAYQAQFLNPDARVDQSVGRIAALIPSGTETLAMIDASVLKTDLDVEHYPMAKVRSNSQKKNIFFIFFKNFWFFPSFFLFNREDVDLTTTLMLNTKSSHIVEVIVCVPIVWKAWSLCVNAFQCIWMIW